MSKLISLLAAVTLVLSPHCVSGKGCSPHVCRGMTTEFPCEHDCRRKEICECCFTQDWRQEVLTTGRWWRNNWHLDDDRHSWFRYREPYQPILDSPEKTMIAGVLYTHSKETLKMTVVFPPLHTEESRDAVVYLTSSSLDQGSAGTIWQQPCHIGEGTWHCKVRFDSIPHSQSYTYEVQYTADADQNSNAFYSYSGNVPMQKDHPRVAALGCLGPDNTKDKSELVSRILEEDPDILLMQGDQTYFHEDLLYGFLETVYTMSQITRNIPTIVQMDDHDYGQGNIWGAGYGDEDSGNGFKKAPCVINAVQDLALGHLPDSATNETLDNGISIHYTNYIYGKTDLAILESRKFRNFANANGDSVFGSDQEAWVEEWCEDKDHLKVVLLQTPLVNIATNTSGKEGLRPIPENWYSKPETGRERFFNIIKDCSPMVLSGDQHLGIVVNYPDFGVTECASPAAINDYFWRLNVLEEGTTTDKPGMNYTLLKVWNVDHKVYNRFGKGFYTRWATAGHVLRQRADGFLVADFDGSTGTCEMHGYRNGQGKIWDVTVPAVNPGLTNIQTRPRLVDAEDDA